jgi:hypothetical protein
MEGWRAAGLRSTTARRGLDGDVHVEWRVKEIHDHRPMYHSSGGRLVNRDGSLYLEFLVEWDEFPLEECNREAEWAFAEISQRTLDDYCRRQSLAPPRWEDPILVPST